MTSNEYSPYAYFDKVISLWWLVALATFLGGVFGYIFYRLQPPEYEATASYIVTIDLNRFPFQGVREDLVQYNEDMAVNTTQNALLSREVRDLVIAKVQELGISLTPDELIEKSTIERKQDVWELRFRSEDPSAAQIIIDTWSRLGYKTMLAWQAAGKAPDYVVFNPPTLEDTPDEPVWYERNKLILAGSLIGFIIGIIVTTKISRSSKDPIQGPS